MSENQDLLFEQWKERYQTLFGKNAVFSKGQLEKEWNSFRLLKTTPVEKMIAPRENTKKQRKGLDALKAISETIGDCHRCKLSAKRIKIVYGEGNPEAKLMFVGEGPGEQEDLTGRPFVGRAGQLLDKIIEAMGFKRSDVFIANVVKCRPPSNRVPEPDEVATCSPFLFQQIEVIGPKVVVALGATSLKCLLGEDSKITKLRGTFLDYRGTKLMPTYHPAYLLRNPPAKKDVWEDMKKVIAFLQ